MKGYVVGARELGAWVGLSDRSVRQLAERGIIVKTSRGKYELGSCILKYCEHLREMAAGRAAEDDSINLTTERALLAREQREGHSLKNAAAKGELLQRQAVIGRWASILRGVSARMRAVPSRVLHARPHFTVEDVAAIDREIREALTEAAEASGDPGST